MQIRTVILALALLMLLPTFGMGAENPAPGDYDVPPELQSTWKSRKNHLDQEYNVCIEHCGDNAACVTKCRDVFLHKLSIEYKKMMFERPQGARPSPAAGQTSTMDTNASPDLTTHPSCPLCGMSREKFAHSRMLVFYSDGSAFPACSLRCAALDMVLNLNKHPRQVLVADLQSRKLVDAEKAVWVVGGNKPGVMTRRAKWAFAHEEDARAFVTANGGRIVGFDLAMKAAFEDMHEDTRMIREKRRKMKQGGGHGAMDHGKGHE